MSDFLVYWSTRVALIDYKTWVVFSFIPIGAFFVAALWQADRTNGSVFKLVHFVTSDTGRGSPFALGYTALVVVCAWGVWALIALDKLSEWYMTIVVGGFILGTLGGRGAQLFARAKGAVEPDATAGDLDMPAPEPAPALARTTTVQETVTVPKLADVVPKPMPMPISKLRKGRR